MGLPRRETTPCDRDPGMGGLLAAQQAQNSESCMRQVVGMYSRSARPILRRDVQCCQPVRGYKEAAGRRGIASFSIHVADACGLPALRHWVAPKK